MPIQSLNKDEKKIYVLLILLIVFFASLPALNPVVFFGHDLEFHINRIEQIAEGIRQLKLPIRVYFNNYEGYGYGFPMFYPELFLFIPAVIYLIGVPVVYCYNFFVILVNLATALSSYYSFSRIAKNKAAGLIASAAYCLSVYRLLDVYTRASVGEYTALVFCPLIVVGMVQILRGENEKWYILAIGTWGVLQSHILTLVMLAGCCFLFLAVNIKSYLQKDKIVSLFKAAATVVLTNLWFVVPLLEGMQLDLNVKHTGHDVVLYEDLWRTKSYPAQIFDILQQNVLADKSLERGPSGKIAFTVGIVILIGTLLFVFSRLISRKKPEGYIYAILGIELLGLWMTSIFFPWGIIQRIPTLATFFEKFQFIWRFYVIAMLFGSPIAGIGFYEFLIEGAQKLSAHKRTIAVCLIICLCSLIYIGRYVYSCPASSNDELSNKGTVDRLYLIAGNTISDQYQGMLGKTGIMREDFESNNESMECTNLVRNYDVISFDYSVTQAAEDTYLDIPLTYYPGYTAYVNGIKTPVTYGTPGVVRIPMGEAEETGTITVKYAEKPAWIAMDIISLMTSVAFLGYIAYKKIKRA